MCTKVIFVQIQNYNMTSSDIENCEKITIMFFIKAFYLQYWRNKARVYSSKVEKQQTRSLTPSVNVFTANCFFSHFAVTPISVCLRCAYRLKDDSLWGNIFTFE